MALFVDIKKRLGNFLLDVKFESGNEVLALLGASGSGKSVTLKCIAGIMKPDSGKIILDGRTLYDSEKHINLSPQKRCVGYLFQQYALFPNMTVEQNIMAGVRTGTGAEKRAIAAERIKTLQLDGMEKKKPAQLSGGQQQRVALARILVNNPEVLLLDEPFAALDSYLKWQLEFELADMLNEFGKGVLYVSHDKEEIYRISDRVAVMDNGKITTIGTKSSVFSAPDTKIAALLTGCKNISHCTKVRDGILFAEDWGIKLQVAESAADCSCIGLNMHNIQAGKGINSFECKVLSEIENSNSYTVMLRPAGEACKLPFGWELEKDMWEKMRAEKVCINIPPDAIFLLKE